MSTPSLVTVAHGTRVRAGNRVAAAITAAAGRRLGVPAQGSYVELCAPLFTSVVRSLEQPSVVVPLLLSTGFHVRHDLPEAMRSASAPVQVARPLGPHPLLAALPGRGNDEHAVETAIARLRAALGNPKLVQTVVKRGYRLALEPRSADARGHCVNGP